MLRKLVIFLVRRKLGLKDCQHFRFDNQKSADEYYYFTSNYLWKTESAGTRKSSVSLNWLLDDDCKITKLD